MHVEVIIPTYGRPEMLRQTLLSLEKSAHPVTAIVIIDGNPDYGREFVNGKLPVIVKENETRLDWVASINGWLKDDVPGNEASVLYASDDLVFAPDCVANAVKAMEEHFPDGDGLVAINQQMGGCKSAFGLMGRKFIRRFPNGAVFCPDYTHWWSDFEIGEYARKIGKFHWCQQAKVKHNRPQDETWRLAHKSLSADHKIHWQRVHLGWLWGQSFKLVTVEE